MHANELDHLGRTQHGLVTRDDLRSAGQSLRQIRWAAAAGALVTAAPGVYVIAGAPRTWHQQVLAACLATGGVASHRTAAQLHGIGSWYPGTAPIEVVVHRRGASRHPSALAVVHSSTTLGPDDLVTVDGITCTSVARTLLLLAGAPGMDAEVLHGLVEEAVRQGKASDAWLWWRLERLRQRGRNGVGLMEEVLDRRAGAGPTESWLERAFLAILEAHGLPLPRCQVRIARRGAFVARVDFIYDAHHLVIEVNGHQHHASREHLAADAARRAALLLAGNRVLDFTYDQVVRSPELVASVVAQAIGWPLAASPSSPASHASTADPTPH